MEMFMLPWEIVTLPSNWTLIIWKHISGIDSYVWQCLNVLLHRSQRIATAYESLIPFQSQMKYIFWNIFLARNKSTASETKCRSDCYDSCSTHYKIFPVKAPFRNMWRSKLQEVTLFKLYKLFNIYVLLKLASFVGSQLVFACLRLWHYCC